MPIVSETIVYRIEYPENTTGPYNTFWSGYHKIREHHNEKNRTRRNKKEELNEGYKLRELDYNQLYYYLDGACACVSLQEIKRWFKGYLSALRKDGFMLYQIKVKDAYLAPSNRQAIIRFEKIIEKIPLWDGK